MNIIIDALYLYVFEGNDTIAPACSKSGRGSLVRSHSIFGNGSFDHYFKKLPISISLFPSDSKHQGWVCIYSLKIFRRHQLTLPKLAASFLIEKLERNNIQAHPGFPPRPGNKQRIFFYLGLKLLLQRPALFHRHPLSSAWNSLGNVRCILFCHQSLSNSQFWTYYWQAVLKLFWAPSLLY